MNNIKKLHMKPLNVMILLLLIIGMVSMLAPYIWMFLTTFKTPQEAFSIIPTWFPESWDFQHYVSIFTDYNFIGSIMNTLIIEVMVVTVGTLVSAAAAFAFAKLYMPGKKTILLILLSSMMIPYATVMLPQYQAYQALGLTDTLWPLIIPGFFGNVAMMFFLIQYMKGIPKGLIEAAKIDGASYPRIFFTIILPLSKPAIAAQIIFWFVGIWNDYFAPSIYLTNPNVQTLQVLIASLNSSFASGTNYPLLMTAAFLASIPMILIFMIFQKYFIHMSVMSGVKG